MTNEGIEAKAEFLADGLNLPRDGELGEREYIAQSIRALALQIYEEAIPKTCKLCADGDTPLVYLLKEHPGEGWYHQTGRPLCPELYCSANALRTLKAQLAAEASPVVSGDIIVFDTRGLGPQTVPIGLQHEKET